MDETVDPWAATDIWSVTSAAGAPDTQTGSDFLPGISTYDDPYANMQGGPTVDTSGGGASGFNWSQLLQGLSTGMGSNQGKGLMSMGSGIVGLLQSLSAQSMAKQAFSQANPFGPYRPQYAEQLSALMQNPQSVTQLPGYQFAFGQGQQAVERTMAAKGMLGSGNEAIALQEYGQGFAGKYLQEQEQLLAGLAGANITPSNAVSSIDSYLAGTSTLGSALAAFGYGATRYGGASAGTPAASGGGFSAAGGEAAQIGSLAGKFVGGQTGAQIGDVAGIVGGISSGTPVGYGTAAIDAAKLYSLSSGDKALGNYAGAAGSALGIYQGLQQGGFTGYTQAAVDTAQLASQTGLLSSGASQEVSSVAGPIGAALATYNAVDNWQSGRTGDDALQGAEAGAAWGTYIMPGVGTLVGAVIGGAVGALSSAFGPGAKDPENANFEQMKDLYNRNPSQGQAAINRIGDKYTALAGLFDLRSGQISGNIPIYNQYGRMGEERFTNDMIGQINSALHTGAISQTDSAQTIMQKVVTPWINSFGKGEWTDVNSGAIQALLQGMVQDYQNGQQFRWKAVGGDNPFGNLPSFGGTLGMATQPTNTIVNQTETNAQAPGSIHLQPTPNMILGR